MDNEDQDLEQEQSQKQGSGRGNPLSKIENGARNVEKLSNNRANALNKSAEKYSKKAVQQSGKKAAKSTAKATKKLNKAKKAADVASKAGKVASTASKLGAIIGTIGIIILIAIAIISLLVFILTGMGLILKGLKDIASKFGNAMYDYIYDAGDNIPDEQIADTMTYLDEMGYGLFEYGFVSEEAAKRFDKSKNKENATMEDKLIQNNTDFSGFVKNMLDISNTVEVEDYKNILAYLYSDNYAYLLRNKNLSLGQRFLSLFGSYELGPGLISLYHDQGNIGTVGEKYEENEFGDISINKDGDKPKLIIKKGWVNSASIEYSLEGWTGRYSMPLEFLLATHVATMSPDLSYKLATIFTGKADGNNPNKPTEVQILLHDTEDEQENETNINAAVIPAGKEDSNRILREKLSEINNSIWTNVWDFADNISFNPEEALKVLQETDLESYTGDDCAIYKCTGPKGWENILHTGEQTNLDETYVKQKVTELLDDNSITITEGDTKKAEIINEVVDILNDRKQISKLKMYKANINKYTATPENNIEVDISCSPSRNENKFIFYVQLPEGQQKIEIVLADRGDPNPITWSEQTSDVRATEVKKQLKDKIDEKGYTVNNGDSIEIWVKQMYDEPISAQPVMTINLTKKSESQSNSNEESNNQSNDNQADNYDAGDYFSETSVIYFDGKYNDKDTKLKLLVTVDKRGNSIIRYYINISHELPESTDIKYCSQEGNPYNTACSNCTNLVQDIYRAMNQINVEELQTYIPYIRMVKDHWFRDVYFTREALNQEGGGIAVETDNEYEKKTGERWTLYELDPNGNYELYVFKKTGGEYKTEFAREKGDDNNEGKFLVCQKAEGGNYGLDGDGVTYIKKENGGYKLAVIQDASANNIDKTYYDYTGDNIEEFRVGKKAEAANLSEWGTGAYGDEFDTSAGEWKNVEVNDDSPTEIKNLEEAGIKFQYQLNTGSITQIHDAVRGQTNPTIKKLFLDDYYIYDGTKGTAGLIKNAKRSVKNYNENNGTNFDVNDPDEFKKLAKKGHINDDITYTYVPDLDVSRAQKYSATIDKISGPINLTHDSLSAFSMLENMHTLDAEYIYHDFKELIVELNYFDKEDLVEPEDEVLMFPVSGVSSAGWPVTRYDKGEDFYGTLIHSAEDLEAMRAHQEIAQAELALANGPAEDDEDVSKTSQRSKAKEVTPINGAGNTSYAEDTDLTDAQKMILQAAEDIHYHLETNSFSYSLDTLYPTLEKADKGAKTLCCASFVGYVAQALGMKFTMCHGSLDVNNNIKREVSGVQEISVNGLSDFKSKLQPGDIVWRPRSGGQGHTQIFVGFDDNGNFLWYNCGSSDSVGGSQPYQSDYKINDYQKIFRWTECELSYDGMSLSGGSGDSSEAEFAGFNGSTEDAPEYVIAPATGEVIKYGTVPRKNKYTGEIDNVGFIKIRLLGNEETPLSKRSKEGSTKFGRDSTKKTFKIGNKDYLEDDDASGWLEKVYGDDVTKVGYDYFWEEYVDAGIAGNVVYLEGFDVSEVLTGETGKNTNHNTDYGNDKGNILTLKDYIKDADQPNSYGTQYEVPVLLDKNKEFELKIGEEAKKQADAFIWEEYKNEKGKKSHKLYIKEGTIIGKTYSSDPKENDGITEKQKVEVLDEKAQEDNSDENNKKDDSKKKDNKKDDKKDGEENNSEEDEIETKKKKFNLGNYMRIILRDTDDEVVENVEEYIETGDGGGSPIETDVPEKLLFFIGVLEEGCIDAGRPGADATHYGVEVLKDGAGNTTAFGLTKDVKDTGDVPKMYPDFGTHLLAGSIPKKEAQDVFVLVMESARKDILENRIKDSSNLSEEMLDAMIDLHHASPNKQLPKVINEYNSTGNVSQATWEDAWGTNTEYAEALKARAHNRGILASSGVYQKYNENPKTSVVEFKSETPWSDFCQGDANDSLKGKLWEINGGGT